MGNFGLLYVSSKGFIVLSFPSVPRTQPETILCAALGLNVTCQLPGLQSLSICEDVKALPVFLKVLSFDLSCKGPYLCHSDSVKTLDRKASNLKYVCAFDVGEGISRTMQNCHEPTVSDPQK